MSKSNLSEVRSAVPTSGGFPGLKSLNLQVFVTIAAIIAIMLSFTWTTDGAYLNARNVSNLLRQTVIIDTFAVGMVFVIIFAEIGLLVGSTVGLLGGVAAICDTWLSWPLPLTIVVTSILGLLLGAQSGWWVAYREVPSFIITLADMLAFRGTLIGITNGTTVSPISAAISQVRQSYPPASIGFIIGALGLMTFAGWQWRGRIRHQALGLQSPASTTVVGRQALTTTIVLDAIWLLNDYYNASAPVLLLMLPLSGGVFMATRTTFGRRIYAIGGSLKVVCLSGINAERTKPAVFIANELMVVITRLILSSRLGAGSPSIRNIVELGTIAACVIGGTSLVDGIGSVAGAVVGALIMASLDNGMSMMDIPAFWQYIVKNMILLLIVRMNSATGRRSRFW